MIDDADKPDTLETLSLKEVRKFVETVEHSDPGPSGGDACFFGGHWYTHGTSQLIDGRRQVCVRGHWAIGIDVGEEATNAYESDAAAQDRRT